MAIVAEVQESIDTFNAALLDLQIAVGSNYKPGRQISFVPDWRQDVTNTTGDSITATITASKVNIDHDESGHFTMNVVIIVNIDSDYVAWMRSHSRGNERNFLQQCLRLTDKELDITLIS
jgi:hypothetical protein